MKTTKPGKQRKRVFQDPLHKRGKKLSAPLSSELKTSYNTRSFLIRTGDTVRVLRGEYKGFEGRVTKVDRKTYRVTIEGVTREKVDGTTIPATIHPSKVMITKLDLDDRLRKEKLESLAQGGS